MGDIVGVRTPAARQRGAEIVDDGVEVVPPVAVQLMFQPRGGCRGPPQVPLPCVGLVVGPELLAGEGTDGLQQAPPAGQAAVTDEHALVDQAAQEVGDRTVRPIRRHGDRRVQVERPRKDRERSQQGAFVGVEEAVAPADHCTHRSVPFMGSPAAGQQL